MKNYKYTGFIIVAILLGSIAGLTNPGHELARQKFHSEKTNSGFDLANFSLAPEIPDFAYWTRQLAEQGSISPKMKYVLNSLANLMPQSQSDAHHPDVGTFSYDWSVVSATNIGMSVRLQADVALGVKMPVFSVYTDRQNIAFNPQVYIEAASHNSVIYHLGMYKIHLFLEMNAFKFTPFDYQVMFSMQQTEDEENVIDYCSGMQVLTDVMDLELLMAVEVLECSYGLFGVFINDLSDCYWKKYYMEEPLAGIHFLNALDQQTEYLSWWCNYKLRDQNGEELHIYLGQPLDGGDKGYTNEFFAPGEQEVVRDKLLPPSPQPNYGPKQPDQLAQPNQKPPIESSGNSLDKGSSNLNSN